MSNNAKSILDKALNVALILGLAYMITRPLIPFTKRC